MSKPKRPKRLTPINIFGACDRRFFKGEQVFRLKPATTPTDTDPGTRERLDVMLARAERGEELYHDEDRTFIADPHDYRSGHEGVTWFGFGIDRDYQPRFQRVSSLDDDS